MPMQETVLQKPTARVTLSTQEGEALLGRLSVYAPSRSDCEVLIEVVRWYFWLVWLIQEAKTSLKTLRTLLFGHARSCLSDWSRRWHPPAHLPQATARP